MGKPSSTESDQTRGVAQGSFTANGQSASVRLEGPANFSLWGTFTGTATIRRSFDGGTTWLPCTSDGVTISYSAPCSEALPWICESGVLYQVDWAHGSGTANYRLSQ